MSRDMPFATIGGCYIHKGDALVPQKPARVGIHARVNAPPVKLTQSGKGIAAPAIEHVDAPEVITTLLTQEADGIDAPLPPIETAIPRRRRRHK